MIINFLLVKSFHVIAMVAWFAGLFYLPRLFVYHADAQDLISDARFKIMERRLYYGITWPAGLLTTLLGVWLLSNNLAYYRIASWMHVKLALVVCLWIYHGCCGHYVQQFKLNKNHHRAGYYRFYNEIPTILLVGIVLCAEMKPMW